jgi:outer membrane protein assembly factor BamB
MISLWPARGAPVVADDTVYYAAGIWPFMGIFLHALDAETGALRWTNDGEGSRFTMQPHNTPSFAGVAPQGALVVDGDRLLVPGGRSVPACYDRRTGRLLHYQLAPNNKKGGGSDVVAGASLFFNGGYIFTGEGGDAVEGFSFSGLPVLEGRRAYFAAGDAIKEVEFGEPLFSVRDGKDRKGKPIKIRKLNTTAIRSIPELPAVDLIRVGDRLFGCSGGRVFSCKSVPDSADLKVTWESNVEGTAARLLAADDRLFVVTLEGSIYCFGGGAKEPVVHGPKPSVSAVADVVLERARKILETTGVRDGYTVVWGAGDGGLVRALLSESELNVVVVEPDAAKAESLRTSLDETGLYGRRVTVFVGTSQSLQLPPYFAASMVCEDLSAGALVLEPSALERVYASLRPYGGVAWFGDDGKSLPALRAVLGRAKLSRPEVRDVPDFGTTLVRSGPLEGAADWTHEHADASNTRTSRDERVKLPLGVLWFGGPSHDAILPRHGHGPQPQVVEGRVIIEGPDLLRATDVYTGRLLWERELPGVGALYDNTAHHPGANGTGANYISLADGIYAIHAPGCVRLDPRDGRIMATFSLPTPDGSAAPPPWNYVNVVDDYLVAAIDLPDDSTTAAKRVYDDVIASKRIYVLNRHDGRVLWSHDAKFQFRNNAICLGGGRLYCIDLLSIAEQAMLKRRGLKPQEPSKLTALDLATGRVVWSADQNVFGTWLSYSAEHGILVESGRPGRDVLKDEPKGMRAYDAAGGKVLWSEEHSGPAILLGDRIVADRYLCELSTGKRVQRDDPLSGRAVDWVWQRNYGCNTPQACPNLLLFRSGAAGFCDLTGDGGTGNFGGFRSSCTNNLIAAGGVLSVPDYTRTCTCDYQNQTSLALVHMPDVEVWTEFPLAAEKELIRLSLNLGAPGFRRAADGTLWLHQHAGAKIEFDGDGYYCRHSSAVAADGELNWVAASGCRGIRRLAIDLGAREPASYSVRLHFCDPDNSEPGKRVFDVYVQNEKVLAAFDPASAAGGVLRPVTKEFTIEQVAAGVPLEVKFVPQGQATEATSAPLLNGIEVIRK